jgi:hypothetical protein
LPCSLLDAENKWSEEDIRIEKKSTKKEEGYQTEAVQWWRRDIWLSSQFFRAEDGCDRKEQKDCGEDDGRA